MKKKIRDRDNIYVEDMYKQYLKNAFDLRELVLIIFLIITS